jgi:DNA polymerase III subunit delta
MKSRGIADADIQSKLGITIPFVWQKVQGHAAQHALDRLISIYDKLLETDLAIKTGRYDGELALNILIAELCQAGR